jgi:hypothetical protein
LLDGAAVRRYVTAMRQSLHLSSRFRRLMTAATFSLASGVVVGCGDEGLADGVSDSTFVETMAELERIERAPGTDSLARVAARTAALQRRGLTQAQLEAAAASLADDPTRAIALYRAIDAKASGDTATRRDTTTGAAPRRRR